MSLRSAWMLGGCLIALTVASVQASDEINWAPNIDAAINMASRQNQLVLIHFWAPNCPPCRALEQNVFSRRDVADAIHRDYVPVKVNAAALARHGAALKVDRWPTDVVITPAGYPVHKMVSPQDPGEYVGALYRVAAERRPGSRLAGAAPEIGASSQYNGLPMQGQGAAMEQQPQYGGGQGYAPQGGAGNYNDQYAQNGQTGGQWGRQPQPEAGAESAPLSRFSQGGQQSAYGEQYANPYASPNSSGQSAPPYGGDPQADRNAPYGAGQPAANPYVDPRMAQAPQRNDNAAPQQPAGPPPQGLDGFCPVTLLEKEHGKRGDERFGIIHRGRLYLFASEADKEKFWTNPDHYSPVLSGNDPVEFVESGRLVPGDRRHGVFYRDRVYLFTNEASLQRFWSSPQRYADHALQAMRTTAGDRR